MQTNGRRALGVRNISIVFALVLFMALSGMAEGRSAVKASKSSVSIRIDTRPAIDEEYLDGGTLTLVWEPVNVDLSDKESEPAEERKNIWYQAAGDLYFGDKKMPAEYIEVSTPYSGGFQPLNRPVLFLKADEERPVQVKFRIRREAWQHAGKFTGYLSSDSPLAKAIELIVEVKEYTALVMDSGSGESSTVVINADRGPGTYKAEQKISVRAITNTGGSNLVVSSTGLRFISNEDKTKTGWDADSVPTIEPSAISLKKSGEKQKYNLANQLVFHCPNGVTEYTFEVEVTTELKHIAGLYKGNIHFTLAN